MTPDKSIDGTSLVPFMTEPSLRTRRPLLFESFVQTNDVEQDGRRRDRRVDDLGRRLARQARRQGRAAAKDAPAHASVVAPPKNYYGIRLGAYKYIEWPDGEKELYDINKDPYELNNIVRDKNYTPIRAFLHEELVRMEECSGRTCQEVVRKAPADQDGPAESQAGKGKGTARTGTRTRTARTRKEQREEAKRERERERGKPKKP